MRFFGDCYLDMKWTESGSEFHSARERREIDIQKYKSEFSVGHTSVTELGHPLMEVRDQPTEDGCYSSFLTARDRKDLEKIARQYAYYFQSPLLLLPHRKNLQNNTPVGIQHQDGKAVARYENIETDNMYLHQYVTRRASPISAEKGTIHHADLDMVIVCDEHYEKRFCTVDLVLDANCRVLSRMANVPLNCSHPTTSESNNATATSKEPHRINAAHAFETCTQNFRKKCQNDNVFRNEHKQRCQKENSKKV